MNKCLYDTLFGAILLTQSESLGDSHFGWWLCGPKECGEIARRLDLSE